MNLTVQSKSEEIWNFDEVSDNVEDEAVHKNNYQNFGYSSVS